MKFSIVIILALVASAAAQSGRQKPSPTPAPRGTVVYMPTQETSGRNPSKPTPTPTPRLETGDIIKISAVLVPIPVSVTDPAGRAVTDLKLADFGLQVDGKPAEIGDMARSETPIRMAMLFDNSSSEMIARDFEKEAAEKFFRSVIRPDRDMAALFSVADFTQREQVLTNNVAQLVRAIEGFPEPHGATALLDGIVQVSDYLKASSGRRVVVIVSDGEDTYSDINTTLELVLRSLQINNCQVYVVNTKDFENYKRTGVRGGNANIRALTAERRMEEITHQTGGEVYSPIDEREMSDAFARISGELSQQYILSYYPEDDVERAGDFRNIAVSVKTRQELTVRTRKGYYVPKHS